MDLRRKVGQLFVVAGSGVFGNERSAAVAELTRQVGENHAGGVIWFVSNVFETAWLNARLQSIAAAPLLVSADLESGTGMRFADTTLWPPAMAVAAAGDPALAEEQGRITAREARAIGVNHLLAPVVDVNVNPANPVINVRSFGEDPAAVARFAVAHLRGIQQEGLLATAKHFPGHGDTHVDSHRSLPRLDVSRARLDAVELVPFRAAIDAGVASVMIGHLAVPSLDPAAAPVREEFENAYGTAAGEVPRDATLPATLSKPIVDGLLRRELGFRGLVVSDSFDMGGLAAHFDPGEAAVRAIEAGIDQVLYSPDPDAALAAVTAAVRSGRIPESRIDESLDRLSAARAMIDTGRHHGGSHQAVAVDLDAIARTVDAPEHVAVAEEIARRSITLVRDERGLLPLRTRRFTAVVVCDRPEENPLRDALRDLAAERVHFLDSRSTAAEADLAGEGPLVLLLALRPKSGAGRIAVPEAARRLAARRGAETLAVSFGSPYVVREIPAVSTFVCAWGIQPLLQRAAVAALRGTAPFRGRLPVTPV